MNINIKNRYKSLQEVIMCYPVNYWVENNTINKELLFQQYNNFINTLSAAGVKIYFLDPLYGTSQVYTRDIGFVIDDILFIGKMKESNRLNEIKALEELINKKRIKVIRINNYIEGGDVTVHNKIVFVGLSSRTSVEAIKELSNILSNENLDYKVIPIKFDNNEMLHLDCVFNILSDECCVVTEFIFDIDIIKKFFKKCYFINNKDAKQLAVNFITIDENTVITSSKTLCKLLSNDGVKSIYIDYSEIIKGGGAFTCTTLPIYYK